MTQIFVTTIYIKGKQTEKKLGKINNERNTYLFEVMYIDTMNLILQEHHLVLHFIQYSNNPF